MLVSVCGLQAFAADGDTSADTGDELVVYTRSGATRTFHVGDTFSYTYWFRLTSGSVNKITGHVLYDSQCLSVNADSCKFPNMTSPSTKNNAGDFEFHDTFTTSQGGEFATTSPQTMANISFTVTRGGTAYLTTLLEELEIRKSNDKESKLVTNFQNKTWSPAMYSTFDYLQDEKPSLASTPLSASSDVAWFYAVDAETGAPIPAGVTFELTGTSGNGKHIERTAVSDAYGFVGFGTVPYGTYYIQTRTASDATVAYIISDGSRVLPDVQDGKLQLNHTLHYRTADPSELRSITVTFEWTNEQIAPDEVYTKDRPTSVYMELSRNTMPWSWRTIRPIPRTDRPSLTICPSTTTTATRSPVALRAHIALIARLRAGGRVPGRNQLVAGRGQHDPVGRAAVLAHGDDGAIHRAGGFGAGRLPGVVIEIDEIDMEARIRARDLRIVMLQRRRGQDIGDLVAVVVVDGQIVKDGLSVRGI